MKSCSNLIKNFDTFAQPITLTFNKKRKFSTTSGGCLTLCLVLFLMLIAINKMNEVASHQGLISTSVDAINSVPPPIQINNVVALYFEPTIMNSLHGKRYFDFQVTLGFYTRYDNGTQVKDKTKKYSLSFCNSSHFPMFTQSQLTIYGVQSWICPDILNDTEVAGDYNSPVYKFIEIDIAKCGTLPSSKGRINDSCASDAEINQLKYGNGGKIYLNLKYVNHVVDLENFEQPFLPYIDQLNFILDAPYSFLQKELSFRSVNILTDTYPISYSKFQSNNLIQGSIYEGKIAEFGLSSPQNLSGAVNYASLYFKSDAKMTTFKRRYTNFQDVLQLVGSFWSITFAIFSLLNKFCSKKSFLIKLANSLYLFPSKETKLGENKLSSSNIEKNEKTNSRIKRFFTMIPGGQNKDKKVSKDIASFQMHRSRQKYKYSTWNRIYDFFKGKKPDYKIEDVGLVVERALDINQILRNNNELDKLKHILLTKEQQMLFNFSTKPAFNTARQRASISFLKYQEKILKKKYKKNLQLENSSLYEQLFRSYLKIKDDENLVSKKIIEILDTEVLKLMDKYSNEEPTISSLIGHSCLEHQIFRPEVEFRDNTISSNMDFKINCLASNMEFKTNGAFSNPDVEFKENPATLNTNFEIEFKDFKMEENIIPNEIMGTDGRSSLK